MLFSAGSFARPAIIQPCDTVTPKLSAMRQALKCRLAAPQVHTTLTLSKKQQHDSTGWNLNDTGEVGVAARLSSRGPIHENNKCECHSRPKQHAHLKKSSSTPGV
jgi:hypothetical protein